jgi:hypothetical protein
MKLILEFDKFVFESDYYSRKDKREPRYTPLKLEKKGEFLIFFDAAKSEEREKLIRKILNEIYPNFNSVKGFNINGLLISSELLNKCPKNISILYEIIEISKSISQTINNADELLYFIERFKYDLFSPSGRFFNKIYEKMGGSSEKGRLREKEAENLFIEYANSKGFFNIEIKSPTAKEDISGIDCYFEFNKKRYTIQTKTLSKILEDDDKFIVYINGYLTSITTDYLILIPDNTSEKYIFKGKNVTNIDNDGVSYYSIPKSDLLYPSD